MSSSKAKNQAGSSVNAGGAASAKAGKPSSLGSGMELVAVAHFNFIEFFTATKKGGQTNVNAAAPSGIASSYKSGPIQVFLNGKIVTPQSLIPKKTSTGHYGKKPKTNITKPQTIDENSSENAEKPLTNTFQSKLNMKR
jgi:hypothetical protein